MTNITSTKRITFILDSPKVCELVARSLRLQSSFKIVSKRRRLCPTYDVTVTGDAKCVDEFFVIFGSLS